MLKCISQLEGDCKPRNNPLGKFSPGVRHDLMLLLCRKAFGEVVKTTKNSHTPRESYLLFTSKLWYLREVSKLDPELFPGAG